MEMRTLSQCLRSAARPTTTTTSLLYTKQFARQSLPAIRYNSSSSSSSSSSSPSSSSSSSPASPSTPSTTSTSASASPPASQSGLPPNRKPHGAFGSGGGVPSSPKPTTYNSSADMAFDEIFSKLRLGGRHAPSNDPSAAGAGPLAGLAAQENLRLAPKVNLKLGPALGREISIEPDRGNDLSSALRMLAARLGQSRLKKMVKDQKFHVRKGQLRKEKRSARWRKLFKFSFQDTLRRVEKMRAQGW